MTLADRVAVFMDGRIVQVATPRELFSRPAQASVAGFVGTPPMNLLPTTWADGAATVAGGISDGVPPPKKMEVSRRGPVRAAS